MEEDDTEQIRRAEQARINAIRAERTQLEEEHGKVWDTDELRAEFEVQGFMAPFVVARRRSDGKVGSLEFQHSPRYYFGWTEDK